MKTEKIKVHLFEKRLTIGFLATFVLIFNLTRVSGQNYHYHQGSSTSSIATSQSGIGRINCDVRNNNSYPLSVVTWDGTAPSFYWKWTDGTSTYSGTVSLPSYAIAPDIAILHNTDVDDRSFIVIIYTEEDQNNLGTCNYVHYQTWAYDHSSHTVSLFETEVDISCNTAFGNYAAIDGDARGFFGMAWASNGDLHTIAGRLALRGPNDPIIKVGIEKTLNLPTITGCDDIIWPDVAMYGKNTTSTNNYIYYSYVRCGGNETLCEQTQNWYDIHNGSSVPSVYSSHEVTVAGGTSYFSYPRIAANQYFQLGGPGNDALLNEFTIVAGLQDVVGGDDYSSILAMTTTNDGSGNITYALYNTTTDAYLGVGISDFFATASGTPYKTDENKTGFFLNDYPVVAYDKTNEHIVIGWSMTYGEGVYNSSYPIGPFPAQVYANPYFDGTNDPSLQTPQGGLIPYNGIDNGAANANSDEVFYIAISSHNTNDLVYAWVNGSGTIYSKVVTSGAQPKLQSNLNSIKKNICYPNPVKSSSGNVHLNITINEEYSLSLFNGLGERVISAKGNKRELENKLNEIFKTSRSGIYHLRLESDSSRILSDKISVLD